MKPLRMSNSDLIEEDPYSVALTIALAAIGRRSLSKRQLRDHLAKRGTSEAVLEQTLVRLEEMGYINDLTFAREFADRSRRKSSKRVIIQGLKERSIDPEIIDWVIEDYSEESEYELARKLAEKKWRSARSIDPETSRRRIMAALQRKGFSSSTSMRIVKELR